MNLFEAGVLPAVPIGAIVGGTLCKSYGVLATIGGVIAGGIAGFCGGWLYGFLLILLMAVFTTFWKAARGRSEPSASGSEEYRNLSRAGALGIIVGIVAGAIVGFLVGWIHGLSLALLAAVVTAFLAVTREQLAVGKTPPEKCDGSSKPA